MNPYLVIGGPTAAGKSDVALEVAERIDGEIVIADSRQVYRGMEIATARPSEEELARVPHHLLAIVDPGTGYNATDYARDAARAIAEIEARGRVPIVCGGTGFYLEALAGKWEAQEDEAGPEERREARERVRAIPVAERHARLARIDVRTAERLHPNDRRRVDRALEVWFLTGEPLSAARMGSDEPRPHRAVWLVRPREELHARIEARLSAMLERGLEAEARRLWEAGHRIDEPGLETIGIQEWWPHFGGERSREETIRMIRGATRQYAKRQETWFRHQGDYRPVPAAGGADAILAIL